MRRWMLSALIATALAVPGYAQQDSGNAKQKEKQDAKQTQQAVKDARKHAKKADQQPYDAMRKADAEGAKTARKAQKKSTAIATSGKTNRFHELDSNANGIIERAEWSGDDRSFATHDWNRDGVLSGDEVKPGAKRPRR